MTPPVDESTGRDEFDTPAEVDAVFRTQRRIAIGYFVVFLCGILLVPALTLVAGWWPAWRWSDWATGFVLVGASLYLFFFVLGVGAATLANGVERRMLGTPGEDRPSEPND